MSLKLKHVVTFLKITICFLLSRPFILIHQCNRDLIFLRKWINANSRRSMAITCTLQTEAKHQIILPNSSHISDLIVDHYHKLSSHSGRQHVLSMIRQKYWIIKANSTVRRVLKGLLQLQKAWSTILWVENGRLTGGTFGSRQTSLHNCWCGLFQSISSAPL